MNRPLLTCALLSFLATSGVTLAQTTNLNTNFGVPDDPSRTKGPSQGAKEQPVAAAVRAPEAARIFMASVAAAPIDADRAANLRRRAAYDIAEINRLNGEHDDASFDEAKKDAADLAQVEKDLAALNHDAEKARERQRAYVNSLPMESSSRYVVNHSDSTETPPPQGQCEDVIDYKIEKVKVSGWLRYKRKPPVQMG
jgi:hypothetical protein